MCTLMTIESKDGSVVTGRTNEFTAYYKSELIFRPRESKIPSWYSENTGHTWENKYSFIYQNAVGIIQNSDLAIDGMNEKGLSISLLYFHYHEYKELKKEEIKPKNINFMFLGTYLLGNFSKVSEIRKSKDKLEEIFYWLKGISQVGLGQHISIIDASGDSIVIEPEKKQIIIKENPLRVLTNSSPLEFHYENLRSYSHLFSNEVNPKVPFRNLPNHKLLTQGNGLFGIPGDFTANSRFIRAAIFSSLAEKQENGEESALTLFRMLHTSDIVPGFTTDELKKETFEATKKMFPGTLEIKDKKYTISDHTDNILVKDLKNLKFYYKTYNNINPRVVDFKSMINNDKISKISMENDNVPRFAKVELK